MSDHSKANCPQCAKESHASNFCPFCGVARPKTPRQQADDARKCALPAQCQFRHFFAAISVLGLFVLVRINSTTPSRTYTTQNVVVNANPLSAQPGAWPVPAPDISMYTVDLDAPLDQCWVPSRHPLDTTIDEHMLSGPVIQAAACPGHDFMTLHANGSVDMSACPPGGNAKVSPELIRQPGGARRTPWRNITERHLLGGVKGVHWAFGFCDLTGLNHPGKPFITRAEWTPYADRRAFGNYQNCAPPSDRKDSHNFDILVIVLDSVSRLRFKQIFARTDALLKSGFKERLTEQGKIKHTFKHVQSPNKRVSVYDFKHTSVYAQNTNGNVRRMFHNCGRDCEGLANVFSHAGSRGFVPSVADDCESPCSLSLCLSLPPSLSLPL